MLTGARQGKRSGLRKLVAVAMARDLNAFVIPGPEVARAHGLDIEAAGMQPVVSPRHASVLLVVGALPPALREAAAVVYAQMMRPRAILVLGAQELSPLPAADVMAGISQQELVKGARKLRTAFSGDAFRARISDFDAPILAVRIEYTCPMHPEVIQDGPGSCPSCGMDLIPREAGVSAGHAHHGKQKMHDVETPTASNHDHGDHHGMAHDAPVEYTCPMHPDVVQDEPGSCPECGMNLELRESQGTHSHDHTGMNHNGMDHSAMGHGDTAFMSMIDVTKDLPRSGDGLPMEWVDAPFGPFFPGLPGGLLLSLTLDGDTVAGSDCRAMAEDTALLSHPSMAPENFVDRLTGFEPMTPVAYRLLACRALENAAGIEVPGATACARIGALERERIASHLGWLALFAQQTGFDWLMQRAASLQLAFQRADLKQIVALKPDIKMLAIRLQRTPLLKPRLAGIGKIAAATTLCGPVARAAGISDDARSADKTCTALGFTPARQTGSDALARLYIRLDEITHSLALIEAAGAIEPPVAATIDKISTTGEATVETPRGRAHLQLTLEQGQVVAAQLDTPSTHHLALVEPLIEQQELGDALVAVGSLDLSPWEVRP